MIPAGTRYRFSHGHSHVDDGILLETKGHPGSPPEVAKVESRGWVGTLSPGCVQEAPRILSKTARDE